MTRPLRRVKHIFQLVGNTPMVKLNHVNPHPHVEIFVKLEGFNPMGSLKDRVAFHVLEHAEACGELRPGHIIVEATSGNTGISLAWVARLKGYPCVMVLPAWVSAERKHLLSALGAELILVEDEATAITRAQKIAQDPQYFFPNQFENDQNWRAHYSTTGQEIWEQTEGQLTHFVAAMGTTGTLMGVGRRLHEYNAAIQVIGVQPATVVHRQEGLVNKGELQWPLFDTHVVDQLLEITDADAIRVARDLFCLEGLFLGVSSGTSVAGALHIAEQIEHGFIVALCGDHGFKYLSTDLYRPDLDELHDK
jgi:cysteine synthase B